MTEQELREERDVIERRQYADLLRLREIRDLLAALVEEPKDG